MNIQIVNLVNLSGIFLFLFATAEFLYHRLKINVEYTRKFVHILAGLVTMSFPLIFDSVFPVVFLCTSFLAVLQLSQNLDFLPSINNIDRVSKGSFYFPVAIMVSFWISWKLSNPMMYYLPILIMVLADPFACLVGKRFPYGKFKVGNSTKTIMGSTGFLCLSFIISFAFLSLSGKLGIGLVIWQAAILAIATCLAEAFSSKGYDNISIPIVASIVLLIL